MKSALEHLFEEQVQFSLSDGTLIEGSVFIGETEFLPLELLAEDEIAYREEFLSWLDSVWRPLQEERRNALLGLFGNEKRYTDLHAAVANKQVVPFVGSGMSVDSGLPTWAQLLRRICEYTGQDVRRLEELLEEAQFEEAASFIVGATNRRLFAERIEHDLRIDDPRTIYGPVRFLPGLFERLVITTNLDNVLEETYKSAKAPFSRVLHGGNGLENYRVLRASEKRMLIKLHGDCRSEEGRVLLAEEYDAAYESDSDVVEELTLIYRHHNLLFLGCSLGLDRTVRLIERVAETDRNMPKHYALLPKPGNDQNRVERESFLSERGIYPIWYDLPHDESITALLDGLGSQ